MHVVCMWAMENKDLFSILLYCTVKNHIVTNVYILDVFNDWMVDSNWRCCVLCQRSLINTRPIKPIHFKSGVVADLLRSNGCNCAQLLILRYKLARVKARWQSTSSECCYIRNAPYRRHHVTRHALKVLSICSQAFCHLSSWWPIDVCILDVQLLFST